MKSAPRCVLAAWLAFAASPAAAQGAPIAPGEEKVTLLLGAALPEHSTRARVDGELGSGDRVDLARDLGLEHDTVAGWFGAEWRFAPRHRLGFSYSRLTLRGERVLEAGIAIDDETYPAGARTSSRLRLETIPLTYSYSVLKDAGHELALTAGLHWSRIRLQVEGSVSSSSQDLSNDADASANLPLPLLGLRYDRHFSQRWSAGAGIGVFSLKSGKHAVGFEGSLWSARLYGEYRFSRHFGAGAALEAFQSSIELSLDGWSGALANRYWGPQVYVTARF